MIGKFILFTDFLKNFFILFNSLNIIVLHDFLRENYKRLIQR